MDFALTLWANAGDSSVLGNTLSVIWRVALVVLGINALIIVHEWGHFIVARMCGVRCEKFYIWFDLFGYKFFSFKWGTTEYGLGWLPLGGYVKMLGQEDNPGGIKAEMERARLAMEESQQAGDSANSVDSGTSQPAAPEDVSAQMENIRQLEESLYAPDSYLSKSVPQRMAIISAGVIMNVIFAIVCAAGAVMIGFPETASRIGSVFPGTPAWKNGLQPGDRIIAMNDQPVECFSQIQVGLMDGKEAVLKVERPNVSEPVQLNIKPEIAEGGMTPTIGITPATSLQLAKIAQPYRTTLSPTENTRFQELFSELSGGDQLVRMNGEPLKTPADYEFLSRRFINESIKYEFQSDSSRSVTLEPVSMRETGIRLAMGEITAIQKGSPAEKAGLQARNVNENGDIVQEGDVLLAVNNEPILDPIKLPYQFLMKLKSTDGKTNSQTFHLTVLRKGNSVEVPVTVSSSSPYSGVLSNEGELALGQLGISYRVEPKVGGVDTDTTYEKGKNPIEGKIQEIAVLLPAPAQEAPEREKTFYESLRRVGRPTPNGFVITNDDMNGTAIITWFCNYINYIPTGTPVELKVIPKGSSDDSISVQTTVRKAGDIFLVDRGLLFGVETVQRKSGSVLEAASYGWNKTVEMMGLVFKFLENVGTTISAKALGGPVMIVGAAWSTASTGDGLFLLFLCMIGANLAVVNFLPIPVLDGGHMVFLIYEAIVGRPPKESVQVILSYLGLLLVLALMVWVIALDLQRTFFGM